MGYVWFNRKVPGQMNEVKLYHLFFALKQSRENPDYKQYSQPGEWVCGYLLPPFQRPSVWTVEDNIRFIDSARQCVELGNFTINQTFNKIGAQSYMDGDRQIYIGDNWLLDGQQRLRALQGFFDSEFPVHGMFWKDLPSNDQNGFLNTVRFPYLETQFFDEESAAEYYDLHNFSGVRHAEEHRARPMVSGLAHSQKLSEQNNR
jgi:hypothetical protein